MNICVIDVGTSSIRSAVTDGHRVICFRQERTPRQIVVQLAVVHRHRVICFRQERTPRQIVVQLAVVHGHRVICFRQERTPSDMPEPGLVEFDANEMAAVILQSAPEVIDEVGGMGAVRAAKARGQRVPDDVAAVGCDDIDMSPLATPALTTIRLDRPLLCQEATLALHELIDAPGSPREPVMLPMELAVLELT